PDIRGGAVNVVLAPASDALRARCERAVRRARRTGREVLVALTVRVAPDVDPSATVFASRRSGEPWFCFEQPDRSGAALAAPGCVRGGRGVAAAPEAAAPAGPPGAGLVAVGAFAFADDGGAAPHWSGFEAADL